MLQYTFYYQHIRAIQDGNLELLIDICNRTGSKGDIYVYTEAVKLGNLDIVKYLLSEPRLVIYNYYHAPIYYRKLDIVRYLLELDITYTNDDLEHAADSDSNILFELLSRDITGYRSGLLNI